MTKLVDFLKSKPGLFSLRSASEQQIAEAERALGVIFSDEYREYVSQFGAASLQSHELTGICPFPRLSVVDVTREQRALNPEVPANLYVVEVLNMDGAIVWQSESGEIYLAQPGAAPTRIAASLVEYLNEKL